MSGNPVDHLPLGEIQGLCRKFDVDELAIFGSALGEEFDANSEPLRLSQNRLAQDLGVPRRRINEIVLGKRSVTPEMALRLARYFGTSERFWLGLQTGHALGKPGRSPGCVGNRFSEQLRQLARLRPGTDTATALFGPRCSHRV